MDVVALQKLDGTDRLAVSASEGEILSKLVEKKSPLTILEVGTGHGYSSAWMLLAMKKKAVLYTIDEVGRPQLVEDKRIKRLSGTLKGNLQNIPDSLDFIFLDSDHQIHLIAADIEMLEPKMRQGTTLVVHDTVYGDEMGKCLADYLTGAHSDRLKTIGIGPSKLLWTSMFLPTQYGLAVATLISGEASK